MLCRWRKLGRERQRRDLGTWGRLTADEIRERIGRGERGKDGAWARGFVFDRRRVDRVLTFLANWLTFWEGEKAHQPLVLEPWQIEEVIAPLFGWVDADGFRRYRKAYIEVPRGNGKTTLMAALGVYLLVGDGEEGAQVWSVATTEAQAMISFNSARNMVRRSPVLSKIIETPKTSLWFERTMSRMAVLSGDAETADGLAPHGALVDELHKHPSRKLLDVLTTPMGKRKQPLLFMTTTAAAHRDGVCWEEHQYSVGLLVAFDRRREEKEQAIVDDSYFAFMSCADEDRPGHKGDDWRDEKTWIKANPNYGKGMDLKSFRDDYVKACNRPAFLPTFQRDHLNLWVQTAKAWLRMDHWRRCNLPVVEETIRNVTCYGGLDLSKTFDLTAMALAWKVETALLDPRGLVVFDALGVPKRRVEVWLWTHFWLPEDDIDDREQKEKIPYRRWAAEGWITLTPGNVIDYDVIEGEIVQLAQKYRIAEIAYDKTFATDISSRLENKHGIPMMEHQQGWRSMTAPCQTFEKLVMEQALRHGNNPILNRQAAHASVKIGTGGQMHIVKPTGDGVVHIDGIVAAVMATGRAMFGEKGDTMSVYAGRGMVSVEL